MGRSELGSVTSNGPSTCDAGRSVAFQTENVQKIVTARPVRFQGFLATLITGSSSEMAGCAIVTRRVAQGA